MFGGKKVEVVTNNNGSSVGPNSSNSIVVGTVVEGNISASSDIRIDGELYGNLNCRGKVVVGPDGKIIGDIICNNAVIEGRFQGKLQCSELLSIREAAIIEGEIFTDKLLVQSGAVFNVVCKMGLDASNKNGKGTKLDASLA